MRNWPSEFKVFKDYNSLSIGDYRLLPIRYEDRLQIMRWRNDQIYHLRQKAKLTAKDQDLYFENILLKEFNKKQPCQILFSLLRKDKLIGYGGLVHINWKLKDAEISFLMNTSLEKNSFNKLWCIFLKLIEKVAFEKLHLYRIFTYSFNLRPNLYDILNELSYIEERRLKNSYQYKNKYFDAIINAKYSDNFYVRRVQNTDSKFIFDWSNDYITRLNSLDQRKIGFNEHKIWFNRKILENNYFFMVLQDEPVGTFRLDVNKKTCNISLNISPNHRGKGIGSKILLYILNNFNDKLLEASVKKSNLYSTKIFTKYGFLVQGVNKLNDEEIIKFSKRPSILPYE